MLDSTFNFKKLIIIIVAAVIVITGVVLIAVFTTKTRISIESYDGDIQNIEIDETNHIITFDIDARVTDFEVDRLKFSNIDASEVTVYSDLALTTSVDSIALHGGKNVYYVKVNKNGQEVVYTLVINSLAKIYTLEFWGYKDGVYQLLRTESADEYRDFKTFFTPEERLNYAFSGWDLAEYNEQEDYYTFKAIDIINNSQDNVLKIDAKYKKENLVKFVDWDGTLVDMAYIIDGELVSAPQKELSRYGYVFDGWDYDFKTPVTENLTINAVYATAYVVTFKDYNNIVIETKMVKSGNKAEGPIPTREGYEFDKWLPEAEALSITKDTELKASYKPATYTVNFYAKGYLVSTDIVEYTCSATAPTLISAYKYDINWNTYTGYEFSGWDVSFEHVTSNMDVHAKYETVLTNPVIAVKTDIYKNINLNDIQVSYTFQVSFALLYQGDVSGLSFSVRRPESCIYYDEEQGVKIFPDNNSIPSASVSQYVITKDVVEGKAIYDCAVSWASGSEETITLSENHPYVEVLRIQYTVSKLSADPGIYWIYLEDEAYLINGALSKENIAVISDYIRIINE